MRKGNLNRNEAVAIVGEDLVNRVEEKNCEPTGRVGYNGACQGDDLCEWSASVRGEDVEGNEVTLVVYYYTTPEEDAGDLDAINWEIDGYEVI